MKVVLVTGGSRGIGAETVKKFASENFTVILNYRSSVVEAENLRNSLLEKGCDVHLYQADISNSTEVLEMFCWIKKYFKRLDVLVNNAGVALSALCQDVSEKDFDRVLDTNVKGAFLCCQSAVRMFLQQGSGAIVNVSSIWGIKGASCESVYSMSKHALVGLTKSLAQELKSCGVKVNCVCPPIVATDMCKHLSSQDVEEFCYQHKVVVYSPAQVAQDIFSLAVGKCTGKILQEK